MIRRLRLIIGGLAIIGALGTGVYYSVSYAYGAFGDYYYVTADLDRAGQQLKINGDVRVRGVKVGKISGIELVDHRAQVTLEIEDQHQIPTDAEGVISLKTPLGAKYMDLVFEPTTAGPWLQDGDTLTEARAGPELEDALDDGVAVLEAINPDQAATIIFELSEAARGRGDMIARGLKANSDLSDIFAATLDPQLKVLEDFTTLFGELEKVGVDLNQLADAVNEGAPVYASAEAQANLRLALDTVVPFADDFADLLILNRDDWDRMIEQGDIALSTIAARPQGLRNLVHGLYRYVTKLGEDIAPPFRLSDGSAGAGFTAFMGGNDQEEEENQICDAFPDDVKDQIPACAERGR
jgi:phospholipid/cholesterol/gamma-HCH transport system substrate-binding protein